MTRDDSLVVWGATGVAGRLVAEYLTDRYTAETLPLTLGGRDATRLDSLAARLADNADGWERLPTVVGDATKPATLDEVVSDASVVCTTVGPYTRYGTPLVETCVETGTAYCDLTGEVTWMREIIDRFHDAASAAETPLVTSCGFDSVPADLGTLLVQSHATDAFDAPCDEVRLYLETASGGISGGTVASIAELFDAAASDPDARRVLANPYSLAPPGERSGPDPGEQRLPRRDPFRPGWNGPSPMAPVNERVVRRTNALLAYPWSRDLRCTEVVPTGRGVAGALKAGFVAGGLAAAAAAMAVGPLRAGLRRVLLPDPGEKSTSGTDGSFRFRVVGRGETADGPFEVEAVFGADRDPGYGATARMLGEAGVCLLREETDSPLDGGVVTPAAGIGLPLADRLREAGFDIRVV